MLGWIAALPERYSFLKQWMSDATGATEELLHLHFGLLIFVVVAVVFRRRMHSLWPVSVVWAFALANEAIDYFSSDWLLDLSALDVLNTVLWPTVLFLVARRRRVSPPLSG
ncbi:MAG: hypothetical protein AB7O91_07905 [Sphingomonas sp.]